MFECQSVDHDHLDLVHDIAYDYNGRRMATCSSDQTVRVWDLNDNKQWTCTASWKSHHGCVWRVSWAHPEFGAVLATCSFDRTAIVWEEADSSQHRSIGGKGSGKHWVKRCPLVESRSNVTDVAFGPPHLGLLLATCSANGILRIYECADFMQLNSWTIQFELGTALGRCSCVAWNTSRYHTPLIAVGNDTPVDDANPVSRLAVYERNVNQSSWHAVDIAWHCDDPIHDVQFAPNMGRSVHYLAVASKHVHILAMKPIVQSTIEPDDQGENTAPSTVRYDVTVVASLDGHRGQTWRVSWNVTGSMLATSGADGQIKTWKCNALGEWECVSTVRPADVQSSAGDAKTKDAKCEISRRFY